MSLEELPGDLHNTLRSSLIAFYLRNPETFKLAMSLPEMLSQSSKVNQT
jgi:hypothetical protein